MNRSRFAFVVGTAMLGLSALTACGGENYNSSGQSSTSPSAPATSQPAGASVKLATAQADKLGTIVVDGTGRTLYVFDKDTASPPKSNCDGDCAAKWPPVLAGKGTPQLDGVDASAVGTVTRTDGSKQLTLGGMPLYQFVEDSKAGDVKGQAVGGIWWVVGADGKKITTQVSDSGNNGY
jgi:predicted lipoprotein with Yx(FWY)xxD motif